MKTTWTPESALPSNLFDEITEVRVEHPEWIESEASKRRRRKRLTSDGRLVLLAVDHPARGVTQIRKDALAMGDRHEYLARTRRALEDPDLDGVVGTSDILEELLILSRLERKRSKQGFLDGKLLVGSMNRGGIAGTSFELEDTFTSFTAKRLEKLRCDGGKMMYRLEATDPASGRTLTACAHAINDLRRHGLAAFLEPLGVKGLTPAKDAATIIQNCGIAAALGESSAHLWLKIPYCDELPKVCRATTLPILLLGGPARDTAAETLQDFAAGLAAGNRIRGAIIGRNLLYPGGDPLPMCRALTALVHRDVTLQEAQRLLEA
jgi:DhnA family fructose-bisphosphate aldolase class Ia